MLTSLKKFVADRLRALAEYISPVTCWEVPLVSEQMLLAQTIHYKGENGRLIITDREIARAGSVPNDIDKVMWWRDDMNMQHVLELTSGGYNR